MPATKMFTKKEVMKIKEKKKKIHRNFRHKIKHRRYQ